MADLPIDRVNQNRAFLYTGIDYAGPIKMVERYKGTSSLRKCWIAIFVCMVTRAIHIELVTDQSSMAFIMAFERFISRRGHCNRLYSDNGTNFRGAYKEIRAAYKNWHAPYTKDMINKRGTDWVFMKPSASHQGGIYEAAVKSTKHHLYRMLGNVHHSYEHLSTFLAKIEAILNSRPLYALTDDPMDFQAITPGHFLINEPLVAPPSIAAAAKTNNPIKNVRDEQQKLLDSFWQTWSTEYLATLMQRKKWVNEKDPLKVGHTVVIASDKLPTTKWELGRIIKLIPSKDGIVRAVKIRTPKHEIIRPVRKIVHFANCTTISCIKHNFNCTVRQDTLHIDDMVAIIDDNSPLDKWNFGRIIEPIYDSHHSIHEVRIRSHDTEMTVPINNIRTLLKPLQRVTKNSIIVENRSQQQTTGRCFVLTDRIIAIDKNL